MHNDLNVIYIEPRLPFFKVTIFIVTVLQQTNPVNTDSATGF